MKRILLIGLSALVILLNGCQPKPKYVAPAKKIHYTVTSNVSGVDVYCGTSQYLGIEKNQQHFLMLAACYNLRRTPALVRAKN